MPADVFTLAMCSHFQPPGKVKPGYVLKRKGTASASATASLGLALRGLIPSIHFADPLIGVAGAVLRLY